MKNNTRTRRQIVAAAALACTIAMPFGLAGCGEQPGTGENTSSANATAQSQGDNTAETFSPSTDLDENGHWEGVTALDYVTLPVYEGIEVPHSEIAASDEDVQAQIDAILANYATTERVKDRAVADGDTLNIDYVGSIDGVEFEGGTTNEQGTTVTIGVTNYIDGFLDQLVGHTPGENFDIEVTFPEDYGNEDLNGKDAVFNITINFIQESVTPELTDEWVAENLSESYGWSTKAQMREEIAATLEGNALTNYLQSKVIDETTVSEIPAVLVDYQKQSVIAECQSYADMYGFELEDMLSMLTGYSSADEYLEANASAFENAAKSHLVFQAIAEDADVSVDEGDVKEYFEGYMGTSDIDSFAQTYGMPYLKLVTLLNAVNELLVDSAVVVD